MREGGGSSGGIRGRIHESIKVVDAANFDPASHQIERADDSGEEIVEVMSNPSGQLTDRLHFLCVPELILRRLQLLRTFVDAPLQRLVDLRQLLLGLLPDRDIMGDADKADMLASRPPPRLRFGTQPAPRAVASPVLRLEYEWAPRRLSGSLLIQDTRQIVRMKGFAPIKI